MRSIRRAGVLVLLVVVAVGGCSASPSPSIAPATSGPPASTVPMVSLVPSPPPSPTPSPSPTTPPTPRPTLVPTQQLTWDSISSPSVAITGINAALVVDGAYLVIGSDAASLPYAARSTDGRTWLTTPLGTIVTPCTGWEPRSDSTIDTATTDGDRVLLTGIALVPETSPCGTEVATTWVSDDAISWRRPAGIAAGSDVDHARAVWPVAGGWEMLVGAYAADAPMSILGSADGLDWQRIGVAEPRAWDGVSTTVGVGPDGTLVMSQFNEQYGSEGSIGGLAAEESRLQASVDGIHWTDLDLILPVGRGVVAGGIIAPAPAGESAWLLVTTLPDEPSDPAVIYRSTNLRDWEQAPFPRDGIHRIAFTRYGYVATGYTRCPPGSGSSCRARPEQYLSTDGLTWSRFASTAGFAWVVDGPAGVIAISERGFDVWSLRP